MCVGGNGPQVLQALAVDNAPASSQATSQPAISACSSARGSLEAIEQLLGRYRSAGSLNGSREPSRAASVRDSQEAVQHAMDILRAAGMADDSGAPLCSTANTCYCRLYQ